MSWKETTGISNGMVPKLYFNLTHQDHKVDEFNGNFVIKNIVVFCNQFTKIAEV